MSLSYPHQKLKEAVLLLASSEEPLKDRLWKAYVLYLTGPQLSRQSPAIEDANQTFKLTSILGEFSGSREKSPLGRMDHNGAVKLAERIVSLLVEISLKDPDFIEHPRHSETQPPQDE